MRERRPGVWEIRVVVANDEVTCRSVQRSFTVHGDADHVEIRRRELVDRFGVDRSALFCIGARLDLTELLERFLAGNPHWRPATRSSNTSVARFLAADPLGRIGLAAVTPAVVESAFSRWRRLGASAALVWGRWAVLRSALSWAVAQRLLRRNPLEAMRAPPRPLPRTHLLSSEVAILLRTADEQVAAANARLDVCPANAHALEALFVAERTRLLVRLAADSGARRGELATLRLADLSGRVLTIERNVSLEILGPTKTSRNRRLTIGATTAAMIVDHFQSWTDRIGRDAVIADWIFAPDYRRLTNARADLLSHRFAGSDAPLAYPTPRYTGSATASAPSSSSKASFSRPKHASAIATQRRRCVITPTPSPSTAWTSPTALTSCSTASLSASAGCDRRATYRPWGRCRRPQRTSGGGCRTLTPERAATPDVAGIRPIRSAEGRLLRHREACNLAGSGWTAVARACGEVGVVKDVEAHLGDRVGARRWPMPVIEVAVADDFRRPAVLL